ncbi:MAG: cryptochrome/photolyase family protein [Alcanivoracaceae bacterium]
MSSATPQTPVLVWYRNDLRVHEHAALNAAFATGQPVRAIYLLCPQQWDRHEVAPLRRWYVLESLLELGDALGRLGVALDVVDAGDFDAAPQVLADWVRKEGVGRVFSGREYPLNELRRDRQLAELLRQQEVVIDGFDHGVLVPPRLLMTGQGTPYSVFTPYRRVWERWLATHGPTPLPAPKARAGKAVSFPGRAIVERALAALNVSPSLRQHWQPGEKAARRQLCQFVEKSLGQYSSTRDFPAQAGTSLLSTALSAGTVSAAECWQLASEARRHASLRAGAEVWISELAWRDFYRQIMANVPRLAWGQPFRQETDLIRWSADETAFAAWCEGRTGYPLVDAAQRQLLATGWMHNRLRMVSAMFLTKHLFIDWRRGEQFFMRHLIDGDFAANNGGWQWSASTGTDAAPYFRVFSPVRQSERFDPEGLFIRRYLPELAGLDSKWIHQPWKAPVPPAGYPLPIVDHVGVKDRVTAAFRAVKAIAESA